MRKLWGKGLSVALSAAMLLSVGMTATAADETTTAATATDTTVAASETTTQDDTTKTTATAQVQKSKSEGGSLDLTIFHVNDTHSRIGEEDISDFSKIAGEVKSFREEGKPVLLLDGGDTFHGRPLSTLSEGYSIVQIYNTMGFDAMVPGNHDYNYGYKRLLKLSGYAKFPILAANALYEDTHEPILSSCMIRDFNGYRVGIFGLSTPETKYKSHPNNTDGIEFADPIRMSKQMTKYLKEAGCDYIIALGHVGLDAGTLITSEDICNAVPEIDLFVDGHSHTKLETGLQTKNGLVVQANEHGKFVGEVSVNITPKGVKTTTAKLVDPEAVSAWPTDEASKTVIDHYLSETDAATKVVVGKTDVDLIGERDVVRKGDSNLGRMVVDAMLETGKTDLALNNGGNVRKTIAAGDITYADIFEVVPFGNILVTKTVTGQDIIAALEQGVSEYPAAAGGFLHIGGGSYTFDPSKPAGSRITEVLVGDKKIDPSKTYTLTTNDFLAAGGDDSPLGNGSITSEGDPLDVVLRAYIEGGAVADSESRVKVTSGEDSATYAASLQSTDQKQAS